MWVLVANLLSWTGGWRSLASSYATGESVEGQIFWWRSGRLNRVKYGGCLKFVAGRSALGIEVLLPFRFGHRPLVIDWGDVSATEHRGWVFRYVDLRFKKQPQVRLRLSRILAEELFAAGGSVVRIAEAA